MLSNAALHRRFLHQMPELGEPYFQTLTMVQGVLRGHRCEYFSPMPGCVCAWFDYGREETTAFRAALDGMPVAEATGLPYSSRQGGCSHASGHDGDMAIALDLCQWLSGQSGQGKKLPRNVLVIFQPQANEGARRLCETGLLEEYRVSRIFGLHLWPGIPQGTVFSRPGALMAQSNEVTVRIEGRTAHFSRFEEGMDAMLAGAEFLRRAYAMLDGIPRPRLLRFGKMVSGQDRTSVSPQTILEGSMLTYREETFAACREGLRRVGREVEAETGCVSSVWINTGYPAVWNDEALYARLIDGLGPDAPSELDKPVLETEDFSFYQKYVPGVFFFLGTGKTPELRSPAFQYDDEAVLPPGVEFLKRLAQMP
ncbi:MAG: M20/M25/M40 family metallo-hydrolase [Oscillibacter sp.]|nr:M20/M25/M40 family metallo-hydrolase [Oscillibacter sp.]